MDRLVIVLTLLLTSCTFSPQLHVHDVEPDNLEVYKGEYVIIAQGDFHPWYLGAKDTPVLPAGSYTVEKLDSFNVFKLKSYEATEPEIVPYSKEEDMCLQQSLPDCYPNYVVRASAEPYEHLQWSRKDMRLTNESAPDIVVGVLDTGVDCGHEDIECIDGYNAVTAEKGIAAAQDDNGHGTHVAGISCGIGDNGKGISGASRRCKISAIKFLNKGGAGSIFDAIRGLEYAINSDVDVVNGSFGGGGYVKPFQEAINKAWSRGIIFVAAAGNEHNDNDKKPTYPSGYNHVVSVASTDESKSLSTFSNYGKDSVSLAAPGGGIFSTYPGNKYIYLSGTSMAAPAVTGLLASILQTLKPEFSNGGIRRDKALEKLFSNGVDSGVTPTKYGRVQAVASSSPEPSCSRKKCSSCVEKCTRDFAGRCNKLITCRKTCRKVTSCSKGCK